MVKNIVLELLLITLVGTALGLTANAVHPDGVMLGNDYFPKLKLPNDPPDTQHVRPADPNATQAAAPTTDPAPVDTHNTPDDTLAKAIADIRRYGLQPIAHDEVVAAFNDPMREQGLIVFIDARTDVNYAAGHIPGAWQIDHYRLDRYIDEALPIAQQATQVIVYCNGGDCEDSKFTATELLNRGLNPAYVFVYAAGMNGWIADNLPVERGPRGSGDIVPGSQIKGAGHE